MVYPRDVLNRLRWTDGEDLGDAVITYVHRGAPGDEMTIRGERIKTLDRLFFETEEASIPYHRVLRIEYRGELVFEKPRAKETR